MSDTPTMNDLLDRHAEKTAYDEANAFPTLPRGTYRLQCVGQEPSQLGELSPYAGTPTIKLQIKATNGTRTATLFEHITPVTLRQAGSNRLARPTQLFNNYLKAYGLPVTTTARELVEKHIMQYPVDGQIEEAFSEEGAPLKFYKTDDERKVLAATVGLKAVNWLKKVFAIRG